MRETDQRRADTCTNWREERDILWERHRAMDMGFLIRSVTNENNRRRSLLKKILGIGKVSVEDTKRHMEVK